MDLRINEQRMLDLMAEQAKFGATSEGGVSRPSLSPADVEVRNWFKQMVEAYGLEYRMDGAGNQSAFYRCSAPDARTLIVGSHFDSVPNGGRFDGALGVISALEATLTAKDTGLDLPFHLEVINFTDEEGTLVGLMGSSALAGLLDEDALQNPRGGRQRLVEGMARIGIDDAGVLAAQRDPGSLAGYVEVHIEQGSRLEQSGINVGVVPSIVGIRSLWLTFIGEAAHAGTMPMALRKDAFWGAAAFASEARQRIMQDYDPGVVNFGRIEIQPGAFNIVPAQVRLSVEFRHGTRESLDEMQEVLVALAEKHADEMGLKLEVEHLHGVHPAPMAEKFVAAVRSACDRLGLSHTDLLSFAGHDAQSLAQITNSVMYFVPSVNGISHNPLELTRDADCIHAANVMLQTIIAIAEDYVA